MYLQQYCEEGEAMPAVLEALALESEAQVHHFVNEKNDMKYTPLHVAIFARNLIAVEQLINHGADVNAKCHGTPNLHLAIRTMMQPGGKEFGLACFRLLLAHEDILVTAKDDNGLTALHLAAAFNLVDILGDILAKPNGSDAINVHASHTGFTALHMTAFYNAGEATDILLKSGASTAKLVHFSGYSALHVAAVTKSTNVWRVLAQFDVTLLHSKDSFGQTPIDILNVDGWKVVGTEIRSDCGVHKTAIVSSEMCLNHHTCNPTELKTSSVPPENLHRLRVLIDEKNGILRSSQFQEGLEWFIQSKKAEMSDVLRVHEWSYVRRVEHKCEGIDEDPTTPEGLDQLDGDTTVSKNTFDAALMAAGAVCSAVDKVATGEAKNAFCPIRPPGHHAGPLGSVKSAGSDSHGFCILNNISIGASYAMSRYRDTVKKVAIVDFDVHHGNGTEETVRWLKPFAEPQEFLSASTFGTLYVPRYKPWFGDNDANNVLFVSVHGYGPRQRGLEEYFPRAAFYPGSGATHIPDIPSEEVEGEEIKGSVESVKSKGGPVDRVDMSVNQTHQAVINSTKDSDEDDDDDEDEDEDYEGDAMSLDQSDMVPTNESSAIQQNLKMYNSNYHSSTLGTMEPLILDIGVSLPPNSFDSPLGKVVEESQYRFAWRNYFRDEIFPRLMEFKPDIIFISAGFDAHKKDTINAGYIALIEEDFYWVTEKLVQVANSCCDGRVVSALEGGYQLGGEYTSAFAKSVFSHIQALNYGSNSRSPFSGSNAAIEKEQETKFLKNLEQKRDEDSERRRLAEIATMEKLKAVESIDGDSAGDASSRKRKRANVDYAALDRELNP